MEGSTNIDMRINQNIHGKIYAVALLKTVRSEFNIKNDLLFEQQNQPQTKRKTNKDILKCIRPFEFNHFNFNDCTFIP